MEENWKSLPETGFVSLNQLRKEMDALRTGSVQYGRYEDEQSLPALDMKKALDGLKNKAPLLYQTLDYDCSSRRLWSQRELTSVSRSYSLLYSLLYLCSEYFKSYSKFSRALSTWKRRQAAGYLHYGRLWCVRQL